MIDINKTYRTHDGREVRIYATDPPGDYPVAGAVYHQEGWRYRNWPRDERRCNSVSLCDLIEVKPRLKRTAWLNLYPTGTRLTIGEQDVSSWDSRREADNHAIKGRLACIKVEIDCEYGAGWEGTET